MAVSQGYSAGLLMGGYDMSPYFTEFQINTIQEILDGTTFGSSGSRTKYPGLKHATLSGEGLFDSTITTGSWDRLTAQLTSTPFAISFGPRGFTLGNRILMVYGDQVSFEARQSIADLVKLMVTGEADQDSLDAGVSLHAQSAETSLPFTGTAVDNAAATTNGGVGTVQVVAIAGASPNVVYTIEHSTDNSTWVTLITFTAITSANSAQRTEVAAGTTVRRYLREKITEGGTTSSVTGVVSFARR